MFPGCPPVTFCPRMPVTDMGWEVFPPGIGMALRLASEWLPRTPVWVCENGAAVPEEVTADAVHDPARTQYLAEHIAEVLRTRDSGVDVRGYYAWSLLDNIEWAEGWTKRFGIVRVEGDQRIPKDSAHWYRERVTHGRSD